MAEKITLKVAEAIQDDVNKGIVRIDSSYMHKLGIRPGDIVAIKGERRTLGIVDRAYPGDIGLNIIRMDGIMRRNAKTGIGEMITLDTAEIKEAKKVIIAPTQKRVSIQAHPSVFKNGLLGRVVVKGDIVPLGGANRRRSAMGNSPFNDVFSMIDPALGFGGFHDLKFLVIDANPKDGALITDNTEVIYDPEAKEVTEEKTLEVTYEDIGGLKDEIKKIREMVELPLKHPEIFERLGIEPPKGVLLHGPPGTGKTLLAKAVANETASSFFLINGPEIMSKFYGQSEANIRKKFEEAEKNSPAIIFIDEIDAIAPKREENPGEVERRVVAQLLGLMDGLKSRGKVVVIAATNIPDAIDPALRRPGRFDREIEIGVPNQDGRLKILKIHTRNNPFYTRRDALLEDAKIEQEYKTAIRYLLDNQDSDNLRIGNIDNYINKYLKDNPDKNEIFQKLDPELLKTYIEKISLNQKVVNLDLLAEKTHGFVGADLASLAREAAMELLRRLIPDLKLNENEPIPQALLDKLKITMRDFNEALKNVRPSAMREVFVDIPNVKWTDIGGLEKVKQELKEAIEWPLKSPESFKRLGVKPPKGILVYGPPGTGKTLLAKAVASESQSNFIPVKGPELLSKWVGESEKGVRKIFKKARQVSPAIIFFDEIDSLAPRRGGSGSDSNVTERVVNQILTEMDGMEDMTDVVVVAATNRPDMLDTALLRPGRFDRIIMAPVPDLASREKIFKVHTKRMPLDCDSIKESDMKETKAKNKREAFCRILAAKTEGYVGADIEAVCREAAMLTLRENLQAKKIPMKFFEAALEKVRPSASKEIQKSYEELQKHFSSARAKEMKEHKPNYFG